MLGGGRRQRPRSGQGKTPGRAKRERKVYDRTTNRVNRALPSWEVLDEHESLAEDRCCLEDLPEAIAHGGKDLLGPASAEFRVEARACRQGQGRALVDSDVDQQGSKVVGSTSSPPLDRWRGSVLAVSRSAAAARRPIRRGLPASSSR